MEKKPASQLCGLAKVAGVDVTGSAWDAGFLAWFSVIPLLAVAVVVALPQFGTDVPQRSMIWMIAGASRSCSSCSAG